MKPYTRIIAAFVAVVITFSSYAAPQAEAALVGDVIVSYTQSSLAQWTMNTALATVGTIVYGPIGGLAGQAIAAGITDLASWYAAGYTDDDILAAESDYVADIQTQYGTSELSSDGFFVFYPDGWSVSSSYLTSSGLVGHPGSVEFSENLKVSIPKDTYHSWITSSQTSRPAGDYRFCIKDASVSFGKWRVYFGSAGSPVNVNSIKDVNFSLSSSVDDFYVSVTLYTTYSGSSIPVGALYEAALDCFFEVVSVNGSVYDAPVLETRPTSIIGNYGIIGNNGQLTRIEQQTIINEGDQTYYNPVTNTTHDMSGWTYDYSTRTYNVTAEDGSESIITYGDDNIIIQEGDQTYNVYYLVESTGTDSGGSGDDSGQDPGDDPGTGDHKHSYTDRITKEPGCTLPGIRTYACSCGDSYTKSVPATGHAWAIGTQVNASYDPATGELLQAGYVIYSCSTCGQQYKDDSNTGPPSSGSSGSSGEDNLFGKLGELLGTAGSGVLDLISTAIGKLLDGAIALLEMAFEKLGRVVEILLSLFDAVPQLFGGYLDMFGAVFAFIPEDIITLLTFGVACVIILGVWKMIRR